MDDDTRRQTTLWPESLQQQMPAGSWSIHAEIPRRKPDPTDEGLGIQARQEFSGILQI